MSKFLPIGMLIIALAVLAMSFNTAQADPESFADLLGRGAPVATKKIAYGSDPDQFAELWLPAGRGPFPTVVMIHGGCWQESLPGVVLMSYLAEDMRKQGYAVWNIEYRRLGAKGAGYPGTFLDIASGVDYLRQIHQMYNLDISHPFIIGHSAGGQLALWVAARSKFKSTSLFYSANPFSFQAVITLAGINDLRAYRDNGPMACGGPGTIDQLIGAANRSNEDPYLNTSPAAMLPLKVQQVIISGAQDPIVPSHFGRDYAALAKASGDDVRVVEIENAGHFELIDPQSDAWKKIKELLTKK
jgi:acetyl esterase/lipase